MKINYAERQTPTKDEERAALKKIVRIIESLGESSYIDIAFEGCIDIAEENIDKDMMGSMKQRNDSTQAALDDYLKELDEISDKVTSLQEELEKKNDRIAQLEARRDELLKEQTEWSDHTTKINGERIELKEERDALRQENIELKAKLYDLISK